MRNRMRTLWTWPLALALALALTPGRLSASPVELLQGAVEAYLNEEYEESIRLYKTILEADPWNTSARKGLVSAQKKRKAQMRDHRRRERDAVFAAEDLFHRGRLVEAHDRANDILARSPGLPDAERLLKKIDDRSRRRLKQAPLESAGFYDALGVRAWLDRDWFKAVDAWERVIRFDPDRLDLVNHVAVARVRLAEDQRRDRIAVHLDMGVALSAQGQFPEALKAYEEVLRMEPTNAAARLGLEQTRRLAAARVRERKSQDIHSLQQQAVNAFSEGRKPDALRLFKTLLERDPGNRLAEDYIARLTGESVIDRPPVSAQSDMVRGETFYKEGLLVEAVEALERYVARAPGDDRAQDLLDTVRREQKELSLTLYREGLDAYARGDDAQAMEKLRHSLRAQPDFGPAKQALAKIMQEVQR